MKEKILDKLVNLKPVTTRTMNKEINKVKEKCSKALEDKKKEYGESLTEHYNETLKKENEWKEERKKQQSTIDSLNAEINALKSEIGFKNAEINGLNKEIDLLKTEMSGMVKLSVVKADRAKSHEKMKISSTNRVRSNIARKSAEEVDSIE